MEDNHGALIDKARYWLSIIFWALILIFSLGTGFIKTEFATSNFYTLPTSDLLLYFLLISNLAFMCFIKAKFVYKLLLLSLAGILGSGSGWIMIAYEHGLARNLVLLYLGLILIGTIIWRVEEYQIK